MSQVRRLSFTRTPRARLSLLLAGAGLALFALAQPASAAPGDVVDYTNFSQDCQSDIGVGVAYDGKYLWVSCYASNPDLLRADPTTGHVSDTYNIAGAWEGSEQWLTTPLVTQFGRVQGAPITATFT